LIDEQRRRLVRSHSVAGGDVEDGMTDVEELIIARSLPYEKGLRDSQADKPLDHNLA
jgi:hypothetical protein